MYTDQAKEMCREKSDHNYLVFTGVLVASKTDLEERRVVSRKSGQEFAESKGLKYFECSAVSLDIYILFIFLNKSKKSESKNGVGKLASLLLSCC